MTEREIVDTLSKAGQIAVLAAATGLEGTITEKPIYFESR